MKFLDYKVLTSSFSLSLQTQPNVSYKIMPKLNCTLKKVQNKLLCTINVEVVKDKDEIPFEFKVSAVGSFLLDEGEDAAELSTRAAEFIYPFVRSSIATLTQSANIPPYMLPILDMAELLSKGKKTTVEIPTNLS